MFRKLLVYAAFSAMFVLMLGATTSAALAQGFEEQFESGGTPGAANNDSRLFTGSQTTQSASSVPPRLQGAKNGTIAPQGSDATYVTGLNTAGTVRVNNLANMEALMNIMSNGMEVIGIAWGGPTMIMAFMHLAAGSQDATKRILNGGCGVLGGLASPAVNNWLVACARDANLFN